MQRVNVFLLLAVAASWAGAAQANGDPFSPGGSTLLDLGRYRTPFAYGNTVHTAHVGRYGVAFLQPVGPDVAFTLQGGYITLDVDGEPALQPLDFSGRYLGLGLRYESTEGDYLNWAAETSYTWHGVDASGINAQSNITWYESWVAAGPVLRWQRWRLSLGGYWQRFDGTEDDGGSLNTRLAFGAGRNAGAYLGIAYYIDQTGSLGIYATSGAQQGVKLVFKREF